ncbi:hypothetical protein [Glycomyces sp. MUSA5-2]|uniref:hypothetical protein n=1 Tax=Glycomyces sp. MUSA5-2 TaxID=2053002 RepID=UPI003009A87E
MVENLYGVKGGDAEAVAAALEPVIGHRFEGRDSSFYGDYWAADFGDDVQIRVIPQVDPSGDLQVEDFPEYQVLIYIDGTISVDGIAGLQTPAGVIELLRAR